MDRTQASVVAIEAADRPARTLAEVAYARMRVDIRSGKLPPGAPLRTERIKARYGIGVSPMREALSRLAGEGLVIAQGQRGFRVAPICLPDFLDARALHERLERDALRASIRHGDDEWEATIVASVHRLAKAPPVGTSRQPELMEAREARHRALHFALIGACGSEWTLRVWAQLEAHLERYRRVALFPSPEYDPDPATTEAEHRAIVEAVIGRRFAEGWALLRRHRARSGDTLKRLLRERERGAEQAAEQRRGPGIRRRPTMTSR